MLPDPQESQFQGVTTELYRAAIGPRGQDAYLRHFQRFDEAGKTRPTWHWPACCITLNWLIYRKLWRGAFTYAAVLLGLIALMVGAGKFLLAYSSPIAVALLLVLLVAACVVPGLYANAWYHTWCNERISTALGQAKDLPGACAVLAAEASSERRWRIMVLVNGVLILLAAGVLAVLLRKPLPVQEAVILPVTPAAALTAAAASEPASAATPVSAAPAPATASSAAMPVQPASAAPPSREPPARKPAAPAQEVPPAGDRPAPVKSAASAQPLVDERGAVADKAKPAARSWSVQVGVFAKDANAKKALAALEAAGLPTSSDTLEGRNGPLTRVRVGPFASKAQAEQAAAQVQALKLPALLVRP